MTRTIRVGLLGASVIAPTAILEPASRRSDVTVQAVAARDPVRARSFAARYGIAHVALSYDALMSRDDIDLVYGKAVLCTSGSMP